MPAWLIQVVIAVVSFAISYFLSQSLAVSAEESVETPEDWETPTIEEGEEIPVYFGAIWCESPHIVWWGDTEIYTGYYQE